MDITGVELIMRVGLITGVLGLITGVLGLITGVLGLITGVGLIMRVNVRISNILFTYIDGTWAEGPGHRMCAKY